MLVWLFGILGCERAEQSLYDRAAEQAARADNEQWLGDSAIHVFLCGTGTPLADRERAGACTAVIAGGKFFLVDVGPGAWENVQLWRLPRAKLTGVLLTHYHSDHIGDLGEVTTQSWIAGRRGPLDVYGPPGVVQVAGGFRAAYALDAQYRVAHHSEAMMPPAGSALVARTIELTDPGEIATVYEADGLRVTAFAVDHQPVAPAYGYRFDYQGRSLVISGDTAKSDNLARHATGADLLIHEALAAHMIGRLSDTLRQRGVERLAKLTADIVDYHATPVEAAQIAAAAKVKMLVLTHLVPAPANALLRRVFLQGVAEVWDGEVVLGEDGMHFRLPAGGEGRIEQDKLDS